MVLQNISFNIQLILLKYGRFLVVANTLLHNHSCINAKLNAKKSVNLIKVFFPACLYTSSVGSQFTLSYQLQNYKREFCVFNIHSCYYILNSGLHYDTGQLYMHSQYTHMCVVFCTSYIAIGSSFHLCIVLQVFKLI